MTVARGTAATLHAEAARLVDSREPTGAPLRRRIRVAEVETPAVVLGSAQSDQDIDPRRAAAAGVQVARRPSGGGAVLVGSREILWVDVFLPSGDPLWVDDIGRAGWWLGSCWSDAVNEVTGRQAACWQGGLVRTPWSSRVCFAGLGPGEVTVDGTKAVGLSQRRTRRGCLFQTAALLRWNPASITDVLMLDDEERQNATTDLRSVAIGLGPVGGALLDAVVERISRAA